jgi:hypothetical protein
MRPNEATTPENRRIEFATLISPLVGYVADERLRGKLPFQKYVHSGIWMTLGGTRCTLCGVRA